MKINILSRSLGRRNISGPLKVVQNTITGLKRLGVKVSINDEISKYEINWVHDDLLSYAYAVYLQKQIIFGPNLVVSPNELPLKNKSVAKGSICLVPSPWVRAAWIDCLGSQNYKVVSWAAGIDTDVFTPTLSRTHEKFILIYFKNRKKSDLEILVNKLNLRGYNYKIFEYGKYSEIEYRSSLQQAYFGIWISGTESQGIAIMEAMAVNLPILVLDCQKVADNFLETNLVAAPDFPTSFQRVEASSAPYFSNACGVKINNLDHLDMGIEYMEEKLAGMNPREYILDGFTIEDSAKHLKEIACQFPIAISKDISSQKDLIIKVKCLYEIYFNLKYCNLFINKIKRVIRRSLM